MPTDAVLRRAGPSDTQGICGLLGSVFPDNPKADPRVLAWQYWDNPFGQTASWIAEDAGEVVGHYAAFPIPGRLGGQPALLAMGADAATAPAARGRGLFKGLAAAVWADVAERNGLRAVLAAPNPNSLRGAVGAGMVEVATLPAYVRPLDDRWLGQRFRVPSALAGLGRRVAFRSAPGKLRGREVMTPPAGLDGLWAQASRDVDWGVGCDAAWWRWRYVERPGGAYRYFEVRDEGVLVGACATVEREAYGGRFVFVLDLLAFDRQAAAAALDAAVADPRGAVGAALVALPGSRLSWHAGAGGFRRLPRRLEPRPLHFGVVPSDPSLPAPARLPWSVAWSLLDHL